MTTYLIIGVLIQEYLELYSVSLYFQEYVNQLKYHITYLWFHFCLDIFSFTNFTWCRTDDIIKVKVYIIKVKILKVVSVVWVPIFFIYICFSLVVV